MNICLICDCSLEKMKFKLLQSTHLTKCLLRMWRWVEFVLLQKRKPLLKEDADW